MQETYFDKLLQKDNVVAVKRLIIGGLLAASAPLGVYAVLATGAACIAVNSGVTRHERTVQQKKLVSFYKDEIGALLHKSPDDVNIEDLKQVAKPEALGGRGIETLQKELDGLESLKKVRIATSSVASVITTGVLVALSTITGFLSGGLTMILGLGLIGFGHTLVAKTVRATANVLVGDKEMDNSVHQRLMRIGEEIKEKPLSPVEVFGLFVDENSVLKADVKKQVGAEYADLPVLQKKRVVEMYEPQLRIVALTDAVNEGSIKASTVTFIASGETCREVAGIQKYNALFANPLSKVSDKPFEVAPNDVNLSEHRKRILDEREALQGSKSLH